MKACKNTRIKALEMKVEALERKVAVPTSPSFTDEEMEFVLGVKDSSKTPLFDLESVPPIKPAVSGDVLVPAVDGDLYEEIRVAWDENSNQDLACAREVVRVVCEAIQRQTNQPAVSGEPELRTPEVTSEDSQRALDSDPRRERLGGSFLAFGLSEGEYVELVIDEAIKMLDEQDRESTRQLAVKDVAIESYNKDVIHYMRELKGAQHQSALIDKLRQDLLSEGTRSDQIRQRAEKAESQLEDARLHNQQYAKEIEDLQPTSHRKE